MDLILWRHAEAEELAEGVDDPTRGLTSKGERHAKRVADWLNQVLPHSTKVLSSPALRARQTAEALDRKFKISEALAPEGTVDGLLAAVRWPDAREPVLVVGHQPTLGLAAAYLMTGPRLDGMGAEAMLPWSIRKGGVWWLRHRPRETRGEVVLVAVRSPELV
ncbi:MAG: histidine phosphatase family protein [Vitreoscilla sp.]|nr:histidine phosphatase family protein [Vitreoscilla sp.]